MAKVFDYGKNRLAECLRENFVVPFYNYDGRGRPISRMRHDSFRLKLPGNYRSQPGITPLGYRDPWQNLHPSFLLLYSAY